MRTHFTAQSSLTLTALCFLYRPLFFPLFSTCSGSCDFFSPSSSFFYPIQWERERQGKSRDPLSSPLLSFHSTSSSSSPLRNLKLSIADSAPREERLRLQPPIHSAWAAIIWTTFTTVGVEVSLCVCVEIFVFLLTAYVCVCQCALCQPSHTGQFSSAALLWSFLFIHLYTSCCSSASHVGEETSAHIWAGLKGQRLSLRGYTLQGFIIVRLYSYPVETWNNMLRSLW